MTRRGALTLAGVVTALLLARSYWLPSRAPTWLRGASPFTWSETRAEEQRCLTFAQMIGSKHPATVYADEDRSATPVIAIDRLVRGGRDSLGIEGTVRRGRYLQYIFYCATANDRGHPGEHRSEIAEPWGFATDWPANHAIEERFRQNCLDSAQRFFPTSTFSSRSLMLRPVGGSGHLLVMATDTVYERPPQTVSCHVWLKGNGEPMINVDDPNARF